MTYLWTPAIPIFVRMENDLPITFKWRQQSHRVVMITDHWRVDVEWWRVHIWRDYYRLITDKGYLMVIYQDLLDDNWFVQQLYD